MPDFYAFMEDCKEDGLSADEAINEWYRAVAEHKQAFMDEYENDPYVHEGWHQQDVIDMYRRER